MERPLTLFSLFSLFSSLFLLASSETADVKLSLVNFLTKLSGDPRTPQQLGWSASSDPCVDRTWRGVSCTTRQSVRAIDLRGIQLNGSLDAGLLCKASSLAILTIVDSGIRGALPPEISNCTQLAQLDVSGNRLSGVLPESLSELFNLKRLDVSNNNFSGELPAELSAISGLVVFLAQQNRLDGTIPGLRFSNLNRFNVSNNNLTGAIPSGGDLFTAASYSGNSGLCGKPLQIQCPPATSPRKKSKPLTSRPAFTYSGYVLLAAVIILYSLYKVNNRLTTKNKLATYSSSVRPMPVSSSTTTTVVTSSSNNLSESIVISSPLVVLEPTTRALAFEDLLKAPAELLGRGKYGSLYKVLYDDGATTLVVKRMKDPSIPAEVFRSRMELIDGARHPNVLPVVAFYCSKQEKLVVYEFQKNGSLSKLLHGNQGRQSIDMNSRLKIAAGISNGLAFMHRELGEYEISHGSLKSTNILIDNDMEPCISEYGLTMYNNESPTVKKANDYQLKADVYSFGILLLELLTRKQVEGDGLELVKWVQGVVREEWTMEVFDKELMFDDDGQERIVKVLRLALKCMEVNPDNRPGMDGVAETINAIMEEEEMRTA